MLQLLNKQINAIVDRRIILSTIEKFSDKFLSENQYIISLIQTDDTYFNDCLEYVLCRIQGNLTPTYLELIQVLWDYILLSDDIEKMF